MSERHNRQESTTPRRDVEQLLTYLKRAFIAAQDAELAQQAVQKEWSHVDSLVRRREGEADLRRDRAIKSRMRLARFPVSKTVEPFRWDWPTRIHRLQGQNHFRLAFIQDKAHLIFLGGGGLGKTPLATALGYTACLQGYSVLFASAIDVINTLTAAKSAGHLKTELKKYTQPARLILDELGDLPIAKAGADLLFQVMSRRYERGAIVLTSNRAFKEWPKIFNTDSTLTSAVLDRVLHHADTIIIEGKSFRMKDQLESETSGPRARRKRTSTAGDILSHPTPLAFSTRRRPNVHTAFSTSQFSYIFTQPMTTGVCGMSVSMIR